MMVEIFAIQLICDNNISYNSWIMKLNFVKIN